MRNCSEPARAQVILTLGQDELQTLSGPRHELLDRVVWVSGGEEKSERSVKPHGVSVFCEAFQAAAEEINELRREVHSLLASFESAETLTRFHEQLRIYENEVSAMRSCPSASLLALHQTFFWSKTSAAGVTGEPLHGELCTVISIEIHFDCNHVESSSVACCQLSSGSLNHLENQISMKFPKKSIISRRGFALVVTLSLMILLTVIAVGLLSLSSIALRNSSSGDAEARAYANARLALILAIGELQNEVGDDRRITADASIIKADTADKTQDHLVGAWSSWSPKYSADPTRKAPDYDQEKEKGFRSWLVSAPDPKTVKDQNWANSKPGSDWLKLFSIKSDGFDLHAAPVSMPRGRIAWVVSQENTKAKINVSGPENDQSPSNIALQVQTRPSLALSGSLMQPTSGWDTRASRVISLNQIALDTEIVTDPSAFAAAAASLSVHASGLLTDVVDGGLKTDLNLGFELDDQDFGKSSWGSTPNPFRSPIPARGFTSPASFRGQQALFRPLVDNPIVSFETDYSPATVSQRFNGAGVPTFDHLRSFYRIPYHLYGGTVPVIAERGADHVGIRLPPAAGGSFPAPSSPPTGKESTLAIRPVLNRMIYILSPKLDIAKKEFSLVITPVISLWNPYNVALEIEGAVAYPWIDVPFHLIWEFKGSSRRKTSIYMSNMMGKQFLKKGHGRSVDPYFLCELTANGDGNTDKPMRFEPGEVRVFCPVSAVPIPFVRSQSLKDKVVPMRPVTSDISTFNLRGGLSVPMLDSSLTMAATETARLTITPVQDAPQYNYFVTLEDATRIKDPNKTTRGQTVTDVQMQNFSSSVSQISSPFLSQSQLSIGDVSCGALETNQGTTQSDSSDPSTKANLVYTNNPRQAFFNKDLAAGSFQYAPNFNSSLRGFVSRNDAIITNGGKSFWGNSNQSDGKTLFPFFEIPREPLLSLAGFQHSDLASSAFSAANQFANSFASPYLAADSVALFGNGDAPSGVPIYDHSYLTNEALWDGYFFSGAAPVITPAQTGNPATAWKSSIARVIRSLDQVIGDFVTDPHGKPLSNRRMKLHKVGVSDEDLTKSLLDPAGCTRIAAHLIVDGAFNVNSTDPEAWGAMLSGLRGQPFAIVGGAAAPGNLTAFPRFRHPTGKANDIWNGFRALNDNQVRTLAKNLVAEVRQRGPFQSLAEFVNRRVSDGELGKFGAVQAAINKSNINVGANQGPFEISQFPEDGQGNIEDNTGVGIPGYLTQADTLQSLAPIITCRSDTFTVRGYGEAKDNSGKVIARAQCEAVVQRMPEFVDPSDSPDSSITAVSPVNQKFGRRFQVVLFRWVSSAEIQ